LIQGLKPFHHRGTEDTEKGNSVITKGHEGTATENQYAG
jgi:hypothetical protein